MEKYDIYSNNSYDSITYEDIENYFKSNYYVQNNSAIKSNDIINQQDITWAPVLKSRSIEWKNGIPKHICEKCKKKLNDLEQQGN